MNKIKVLLITIFVASSLYAQAPEMKSFVPTEWQFMENLSEKETEDFKNKNQQFFDICAKISWSHLEERHCREQNVCYDETKVYKEEINGDIFYWILVPGNRMDDTKKMMEGVSWVSEKHYFLGLVKVENGINKLLMFHPTLNINVDEKSCHYFSRTYQIIKGKEKNKGVIYYENQLNFELDSYSTKFRSYQKLKNQPVGHIKTAAYFLFEGEPAESEYREDFPGFILKNWTPIRLSASNFLWDLKDPLKYGLQNAFDNNSATSYVENTEDDLMKVEISVSIPVDKIAVINGYAENQNLYIYNNSVQEIGIYAYEPILINGEKFVEETEKQRIICSSNNLDWQIFEFSQVTDIIKVKSYYKGKKYNDTCIAELNFYYENHYLFGEINE